MSLDHDYHLSFIISREIFIYAVKLSKYKVDKFQGIYLMSCV